MKEYIEAILKALVQHQVCAIARDAGGRFPNSNRVGRSALASVDNIMQLNAMMSGSAVNPLSGLADLLQQGDKAKQPDIGAILTKLDKRLPKLEARK